MTRALLVLLLSSLAGGCLALAFWQPWASTKAGSDEPKRDGFAGSTPKDNKRDGFAQTPGPAGTPVIATLFDGDRAMKYLKELCDIGTRISGSEGMSKQQDLLVKHFEKHGGTVSKQVFEAKAKSRNRPVTMTNLIAKWYPEKSKRIILSAHYDTRPQADEEVDRTHWNKPFLSANDGTSGVAFLMEIAHHLKDLKCNYGIDLVLFDGEEYIFDKGRFYGDGDDFFHGSIHFGEKYEKERRKLPWNYEAAVNFDLFASKDARLAVEGYSQSGAPALVSEIWGTASVLNSKHFKYERGFRRASEVLDDHVQLQRAGIPAVDVIDFDYPHWHKLSDLPAECSASTMNDVGRVIMTWLQQKK